jgi:hypothetical protein
MIFFTLHSLGGNFATLTVTGLGLSGFTIAQSEVNQ